MYNKNESFKEYEVKADNVEDFLKRYSKPKAHELRGKEYVEYRINSYKEELKKYGFCFITHHDSITGEIVSWYGNND